MLPLHNMTEEKRKERYQKARAGFVMQGTTLTQWCKSNDTYIQNVRDAFLGKWNGPSAQELVKRVECAAKGLSK